MPLRVTCQCGVALNVPETMAGKGVKCPKCQSVIAVGTQGKPAAMPKPAAAQATKPTAAKPAAVANPASSSKAPQDAMSKLLDSAGLKKREGIFCPSCDRSLPPGTAICVGCGYSLQAGSKIEGFEVETKEFGNKRLVEAAEMMARESETESRLLKAGMPWWMMAAIILAVLFMMTAILLKMDAKTSGNISSVPLIAKLQSANYLPVIAFSAGGGACLIALFALLAIIGTAYKESIKEGLLCSLTILYSFYYMFSRLKTRRLGSTVLIFWISAIVAGICLGYSLPKI
ncbi:MAG: hypothetical protein ACK6AT_02265 [Planctomycetota bacterium]|jgi:hypothetical protein|nr:hypothetical protein [Planctomycetaceae bacterium]